MAKSKSEPETKTAEQWCQERDELHHSVSETLRRLFASTDAEEATKLHGQLLVAPRQMYDITVRLEVAKLREQAEEIARIQNQAEAISARAAKAGAELAKTSDPLDRECLQENVRVLESKSAQLRRQAQVMHARIGDVSGLDSEREETLPSAILNAASSQRQMLRHTISASIENGHPTGTAALQAAAND